MDLKEIIQIGIPIVISIISVLVAIRSNSTANAALNASKNIHEENKRINLRIKISDVLYDVGIKLNQLALTEHSILRFKNEDLELLNNINQLFNDLYPDKTSMPQELIEQQEIGNTLISNEIKTYDNAIKKIKETKVTIDLKIKELQEKENPSAEDVAKLSEIKTTLQRDLDTFSEINKISKTIKEDLLPKMNELRRQVKSGELVLKK